jgi:hypothetical protein
LFPPTCNERENKVTKNIVSEGFGINTAIAADPVLAKHAAEIRRIGKCMKEDVIELGRHLAEARDHAGHGTWLVWIEWAFGWSDQTAYRFLHLYEAQQSAEFHKLWNSDLPLSALFQLAAPNTPPEAREEISDQIEAGEKPTVAEVANTIKRAKQAADGTAEATTDISDNTKNATAEDDSAEQRKAFNAALFSEPAEQPDDDPSEEEWARINAESDLQLSVADIIHRVDQVIPLNHFLENLSPEQTTAIGLLLGVRDAGKAVAAITVVVKECLTHWGKSLWDEHTDLYCAKLAEITTLLRDAKTTPENKASKQDHGASRRGIGKAGPDRPENHDDHHGAGRRRRRWQQDFRASRARSLARRPTKAGMNGETTR